MVGARIGGRSFFRRFLVVQISWFQALHCILLSDELCVRAAVCSISPCVCAFFEAIRQRLYDDSSEIWRKVLSRQETSTRGVCSFVLNTIKIKEVKDNLKCNERPWSFRPHLASSHRCLGEKPSSQCLKKSVPFPFRFRVRLSQEPQSRVCIVKDKNPSNPAIFGQLQSPVGSS